MMVRGEGKILVIMMMLISILAVRSTLEAAVLADLDDEASAAVVSDDRAAERPGVGMKLGTPPVPVSLDAVRSLLRHDRPDAVPPESGGGLVLAGARQTTSALNARIERVEELLGSGAGTTQLLEELGNLYLQTGRLDLAAECFYITARSDPASLNALAGLGFALLSLQDYTNGHAVYEKLLQLSPSNRDYDFNLGTAKYNLGQPESAATIFAERIRVNPHDYKALYNKAVIAHAQGDAVMAEADMRRVIRLKPQSYFAYCALARIVGEEGREDEKQALLKQALAYGTADQIRSFMQNRDCPLFLLHAIGQ